MRAFLLAILSAAVVFFAPPAAFGNGRFPASNQIAFLRIDRTLVVARTTFGIFVSHDGGITWRWLCEDALGIPPSSGDDPPLGITGSGKLIAGPKVANGLVVSPDTGCNWQSAIGPLNGNLVVDLVVRPDSPDVALALTSNYGRHAGADGAPGYGQQVYESTDGGENWFALGAPIDPGVLVTTIDVAASDPSRVYVSAIRDANGARTASLFVSTDSGAHWIERGAPLDPRESAIYIAAVDPTNAERVYVRTAAASASAGTSNATPSRLLVTGDGGQTFEAPLSLHGQMLGFALSPDGSKVYAGNIEQGLFVATRDSLSFRNVSPIHVQCLATLGPDLWACSDEAQSGFIAGVSSDDGATFAPRLHLLAQPMLQCAANSTAAVQCGGAPLQMLCASLPGCDTDAGGAPVSTKSCGCSLVGHGEGAAALGAAASLAAIALMGRPRARRSTR